MHDLRVLRARRIADRALSAWEQGASADQLSDFLEEIHDVLSIDPSAVGKDLEKHIQTLERRLVWIESRQGGSYDEREASALKVAVETLRQLLAAERREEVKKQEEAEQKKK